MTRRSLHIGLNRVDPGRYDGWDGQLSGCINDADAMVEVAKSRGFTPQSLIDDAATIANVRDQLTEAAAELVDGDFFFLTYSGHGGQVPDTNGDESDGYDETWCLYDTELVDDSLYGALCTFSQGVRIFVMSDSCHSETVTRARPVGEREALRKKVFDTPGANPKRAPRDVTVAEYRAHIELYQQQTSWFTPKKTPKDALAKVVLLAGCQDNQTSMDGPRNGAFTGAFLEVWNDGEYTGDYQNLVTDMRAKFVGTDQTPSLLGYGVDFAELVQEQVLKLE